MSNSGSNSGSTASITSPATYASDTETRKKIVETMGWDRDGAYFTHFAVMTHAPAGDLESWKKEFQVMKEEGVLIVARKRTLGYKYAYDPLLSKDVRNLDVLDVIEIVALAETLQCCGGMDRLDSDSEPSIPTLENCYQRLVNLVDKQEYHSAAIALVSRHLPGFYY